MPSDYSKFRGKCKEFCENLIKENPSYTLTRGYYYCPIWNTKEQHWWCKDEKGNIIDPTKDQFPSKGIGEYEEFDGIVECSECGKEMKEEEASYYSNYVFCSTSCTMRFVGL